ncbi:MAG UNVERIFIED_CONTAM: hypothetical protein LVR18_37585 [Planctomycetaceae bacterium]
MQSCFNLGNPVRHGAVRADGTGDHRRGGGRRLGGSPPIVGPGAPLVDGGPLGHGVRGRGLPRN